MKHVLSLSAAFLLSAVPLLAEPATGAGADRIATALTRYMGPGDGVVTVVPEGETYRLTLDFSAYAKLLERLTATTPDMPEELDLSLSPLVYTLTDNGDGTWGVSDDQGLTFTGTLGGTENLTTSFSYGQIKSLGTFDESLRAFTEYRIDFTDFTSSSQSDYGGAPSSLTDTQSIAAGQVTATARAGERGGIDGTQSFAFRDMQQVQRVPFMPGQPPVEIRVTSAHYGGDATYTGLRNGALLDILAFFVARPSVEAILADQEVLREALKAALPVAETLSAKVAATRTAVGTPFGTFGIDTLGFDIDMTGLVADARLRERIELLGVTVPESIVPPWATPLIPTDVVLDVEGAGLDLAATSALFLDEMDMTTENLVSPEVQVELLSRLFPEGRPADLFLHPSRITGAGYELAAEIAAQAGPAGPPVLTATLRLTGVETIQAAINSAPQQVVAQAGPMLAMATGMARRDGDALVWDIALSEDGMASINGMAMPLPR